MSYPKPSGANLIFSPRPSGEKLVLYEVIVLDDYIICKTSFIPTLLRGVNHFGFEIVNTYQSKHKFYSNYNASSNIKNFAIFLLY